MRRTKVATAIPLALLVAAAAFGQAQPNTGAANLQINGNDPTFTGPYPLAANQNAGDALTLTITDTNGSRPFLLIFGTLLNPGMGVATGNLLNVDPGQPIQTLLNGVTDPAGAINPWNAFAFTNGAGLFNLFGAIPFTHPTGVLTGSGGTFQAAVGDPAGIPGLLLTLTAATTVNVTAVAAGTLPLGDQMQANVPFQGGMTFSFYGMTYSSMNVIDNGCVGFGDMAGLLAVGQSVNGAQAVGVSVNILGLGGGGVVPPNIGIHSDFRTAIGGGTGSVQVSQDTNNQEVMIGWIGVTAAGTVGAPQETFAVKLYMDGHATSPGQADIICTSLAGTLNNFARSFGISPGGSGTVSNSSYTTPGGVNFSGQTHSTTAGLGTSANAALYQVFNFSSPQDPINPVIDLSTMTLSFSPAPATTPANGPYSQIASPEPPATLTSVAPANALCNGGTVSTLIGRGFRNDGSNLVSFGLFGGGAVSATGVTVLDSERITCTVPPAEPNCLTSPTLTYPFTVDVNLSTAYSPLFVLNNGFTYQQGMISGAIPILDEEYATIVLSPYSQPGFGFYGAAYSCFHVHANGFIELSNSTTNPASGGAQYVSSAANFLGLVRPKVAPLFNDICGDQAGCGLANPAAATYTENVANSTFTATWTNWAQWPNANQGLTFSAIFEFNTGKVTLDYSGMMSSPNAAITQGGATTGIIVGISPGNNLSPAPNVSQNLAAPIAAQPANKAIFQLIQGAATNTVIWLPNTSPNKIVFTPNNVTFDNQYSSATQ